MTASKRASPIVSRETPLDAAGFAVLTGADAHTLERLQLSLDLLIRWQKHINLVGSATLEDPWRRHVLDSGQLLPLLPSPPVRIADLGSGAGFPGLVLAIMGGVPIDLIESDARKCAFLREAARLTAAPVQIRCARIESLTGANYDVAVARALAPLPQLLGHAANCLSPQGVCLFLKGRRAAAELTDAGKLWKMRTIIIPSRSDPEGVILKIEELAPRHDL